MINESMKEKDVFLGFKAYAETDADIFKGRTKETEYLYDLVTSKDYVVCYAESGEGKSSLIDAGLTPRLRANCYFSVKISFTDDDYNDYNINFDKVIKSRILEAINGQESEGDKKLSQSLLSFVPKSDSIFNEKYSDDLWWFLRNNTLSLYGVPLTLVLIFDQFEEVINYPKSNRWTSRFFAFLEKISMDNCPKYILDDINATIDKDDDIEFPEILTRKNFKAVFSIRTEYIGELDYWCMQRYFIPDLKHNRFCLKALTIQGADEIMRQYEGFDDELCDTIKEILIKEYKKKRERGQELSDNCVSALILSVICTSLYHSKDKVLSKSFITDSIVNFYNDIIFKSNISIEERNTIASVLVDKDRRLRVASDCPALEKIEFNRKYKNVLLQKRLIKKSNVNGVEYIELVHDSLISVVKRHKEEAKHQEMIKRRKRNAVIVSSLVVTVFILVFLILGFKKNERNYLITQVRFISNEAEKLVKEKGNTYECIKLFNHVAKNNRMSTKVPEFERAIKTMDCNYKFPERHYFHDNIIWDVSFSPDGRYLATASYDKTSRIWSVESGECLHILQHEGIVDEVSFSPDGRYVVTASMRTSKLWSMENGECLMTMKHEGRVVSSSFSSDGKLIATASYDNTVKIWSVESGECLRTIIHDDMIFDASFSLDGKYVVTASFDNTSRVWDVENGECLHVLQHDGVINYATFSADGRYIVTASFDNTSKLWSVESGKCLQTMRHDNSVIKAVFSPDGKYVVTASFDKTSRVWSVESGECLHIFQHEDLVNNAIFSDDGRYILTASFDNTSRLWSMESGRSLQIMRHENTVSKAIFSPDGRQIVTVSYDNSMKLWSIEDYVYLHNIKHESHISSISFSPDGKYVVTSSYDNTSKVWSVENGECILTMQHEAVVMSALFSKDGKKIFTITGDNTLKLWDMETGECLKTIKHDGNVFCVSLSPDGRYVAEVLADKEANVAEIWSLENGESCQTIYHKSLINSINFSSDGKYIITASFDNTSKLWRVEDGECLHTFQHEDLVNYASFSADGRYVLTVSHDQVKRIWSVESGECIFKDRHDDWGDVVKFTPDGKEILVVSTKSYSNLYSVESGAGMQEIQHKEGFVSDICIAPDGSYIIVAYNSGVTELFPIRSLHDIIDSWSKALGSDAELSEDEKSKYYLN